MIDEHQGDAKRVPLTDYVEYAPAEMLSRAAAFARHLKRRRTVRDFADRPVDAKIVGHAIDAAGTAPSGANHQPWHFVVIRDPERRKALREAAEKEEQAFYEGKGGEEWLEALAPLGTDSAKPFLETAPVLIAVFAQKRGGERIGQSKKNYYINESVGIACGFMLAALHEAGLVTLTHTPNPMKFLTEICGRPLDEKPFMLIVAGYPAEDATVPEHALIKKTVGEISTWL
ncbi:nitroreductase family protein [uncultured Maricaulis sp.]|uniref:nitroreductase family protein n=1 Tax=uncultured Maricaulis sp. TaxID=174710 RepID=UPI0030D95FC3|tara:strand:+ start:204512 stop:205201 length:690 start_codon:yes stop_codon:yes gene_type:complete